MNNYIHNYKIINIQEQLFIFKMTAKYTIFLFQTLLQSSYYWSYYTGNMSYTVTIVYVYLR